MPKITINTHTGKQRTIVCDEMDSIEKVKKRYRELTHIFNASLKELVLEDPCFLDHMTVADCKLSEYDSLHMFYKPEHKKEEQKYEFEVYFKNPIGKTESIPCNQNDSILSVKQQCAKMTGIPIEGIRMVFAGKELENERTLADYRIDFESKPTMIFRNKYLQRYGQFLSINQGLKNNEAESEHPELDFSCVRERRF